MPKATNISVANLRRVPGGAAQETWFFDAQWQEGDEQVVRKLVLRRSQEGGPLATDRVTEFKVLKSLEATPVPVPRVYWAEGGSEWLERPFLIMDRLEGEVAFEAIADPERKRAVARDFVKALANLHALDWQKLGLSFLGVPQTAEECAEREVDRWASIYSREELEPQPLFEAELLWLRRNKPKSVERVSLLWGDVGPGNFIFRGDRVSGLIDAELAHLGDPMDDLGFLLWRSRARQMLPREELLETYERFSGIKVNEESVRYYQVLSNLKTAVMVNTATRGYCDGRSNAPHLAVVGLSIFRNNLQQAAQLAGL
ncbi:MAG: phosphotransferase family protein [Chloroflexi bacterium]|nr:phosphotransferase family protein [Chloroflexota bacterium]